MPMFGPISHSDLVRNLKAFGFEGPYSGGKHLFMVRDGVRLTIPNRHQGDIKPALLAKILRQAEISREAWEAL
jgi:predicted RNA binding protein YcfA (HicA-like mRNA interferase family)